MAARMPRWFVGLAVVAGGCRGTPRTEPISVVPPTTLGTSGCDPATPAAACAELGGRGQLAPCPRDAPNRVGEWRYALVAPLHATVEDIGAAELAAMLRGDAKRELAMSAETAAVLHGSPAAPPGVPDVTEARWAIVPVDELVPQWKVITVDGHPLAPDDDGPLTVPLCASQGARITNLDPAALTTVAMTGTTAMARLTAVLMDAKGVTYPARDVAGWFVDTDFVHVSNEVSVVPACEPKGKYDDPFCSRERYIALLEAIHANIVELDGSHLSDHGWKWLTHTIEMYEARGWHFFGGGRDQLEATRPLLLEHHGNKLALLGCNMPRSTAHTIRNGPNVGYCDVRRLDWQVRDLRRRGYIPIVSIQHEEVYAHDPPDGLVHDFRRLAEAGAAVVFGSQAHFAHPWEVHYGAYLHYGAGNFFFDQSWPGARDAAADRLYFYRGRLLTVGHLYTRLEEHGRPRPMTSAERVGFERALDTALGRLPHAAPWAAPRAVAPPRVRPDSFLFGTEVILLGIEVPDADEPLVVTLLRRPRARGAKLVTAITDFVGAKYAIAPARIAIVGLGGPRAGQPARAATLGASVPFVW